MLYNGYVKPGEHVRVFPLANWTELDVWRYVREEGLELPPLYFAHRREVFRRDGMLYATSPYVDVQNGETPFEASVRFRTVGDMTCTGAVCSDAATLDEVIAEIAATRVTERGETRADDRFKECGGPRGGRGAGRARRDRPGRTRCSARQHETHEIEASVESFDAGLAAAV